MSSQNDVQPLAMEATQANRPVTTSPPNALDRYMVQIMTKVAGNPKFEIELWDGSKFYSGDGKPIATLKIRSRAALQYLISNPEVGFGDEYSDGQIAVHGNLLKFLCELFQTKRQANLQGNSLNKIYSRLFKRKVRENTLERSKANIHHHYDLGNYFYSLWLDTAAMQYTCAYFPQPDLSIEQAQIAKMEHVCRKLQLKAGQSVVEAGCGWGGLALYMAKNYGVKVKSYNISHEQIVYATERARTEGMTDRVEYVEDDYRNICGTYDVFVSVGMLEHVGRQNYSEFGSVVNRCLTDNGRALIHSIGRNASEPMSAWTEKRIFPGAFPPTIREMMDIVEPFNLSVLDIENLRLHYAQTLRHWLQRFDENEQSVLEMFDERFVRAWRLYLTGSIAAFLVGSLQLFQMVIARGLDNNIPMTREHQYLKQVE